MTSATTTHEIPDLGDPATFVQGLPIRAFDAIHAKGGFHWQPATLGVVNGGFWFVANRAAIREMELDAERFTATRGVAQPYTSQDPDGEMKDLIFAMDPPRHSRIRRAVVGSFGPRVVAQFERWVTDIVVEALDDAVRLVEFDYMPEVAVTIPARVVARIMGVPDEDRDNIVRWTVASFQGQATGQWELIVQAANELFEYATALQAEKLANPADDMISELAAAVVREELNQVEFLQYCRGLMLAGFETTHTIMGQAMRMQLEDSEVKDQHEGCMDRGEVEPLIEEYLRMVSPAMHFARTATKDMSFYGQDIKQYDVMLMSYAAANRDPAMYETPHDFRPGRPHAAEHMAFGNGFHRCVGSALAKLEMRVLFEQIHERGLRFELAGVPQPGWSSFINQIRALPVRVVND